MSDLVTAIGLLLVIEGIVYGGLPHLAKRLAAEALAMPEGTMRLGGIVAAIVGVVIVWLARS